MAAEPQVACPEDWTPEQVEEFRKAWDEYWATTREHKPRWLPASTTVTGRPQQLVVHLRWTEGGALRQDIFGPWTVADDDSHLERITAFMRDWNRIVGDGAEDAVMVLLADPGEWVREHEKDLPPAV